MALIYSQGGRLGNDQGGLTTPDQFSIQGVTYTGRRPVFVWFRGDLYIVGSYTRPVVRHGQAPGTWYIAGIRPPQIPLTVAPGASSGGSSGAALCAITFLHKAGQRVLAESNFGNVVDVGTLTGQGRVWSNVDNISAEARVTHVRGYCSMDGADFRAVWESPYGLTGYTENVRTSQFTFSGPEDFSHNIPPSSWFAHEWAGRMWYARSDQFPYRVWYSMAGFPQYVKAAAFRDTIDREPITAIWKGRNELLVFGIRSCQMIRQFGSGEDDFVIEKLDSDVGSLTHFGFLEIHNKLWFPAEDGIWIYDGSFKFLMKEMLPVWREDWRLNKPAFLDGFAMHDRVNKVYMFVTRRAEPVEFENTDLEPATLTYCGYYGAFEPSMQGEQPHPDWTLDMKGRYDSVGFYNSDGELLIGSCDGVIRKQDWTNGDDDGDTLQKALRVRTGHMLFMEPGDDWEGGKQLLQLWGYVESETTAWTIYCRGGDEQVWKSVIPDNDLEFWKADVSASLEIETRQLKGRDGQLTTPQTMRHVPKTTHYFQPAKVTGRGFTFELRAVAPVGFQFRGLGGMWGPGPASIRPVEAYTIYSMSALEWSYNAGLDWFSGPIALNGQATFRFRTTVTLVDGAFSYPITGVFDATPDATSPDQTVVLAAAPSVLLTSPDMTFPLPYTGTVVVHLTDNDGVVADSPTLDVALTP